MAKYIGETNKSIANGLDYAISTQDMTGKIYKPGKNEEGKWIDIIGEADKRIMLWASNTNFYKVYNTAEELLKEWKIEGSFNHYSPRTREGVIARL